MDTKKWQNMSFWGDGSPPKKTSPGVDNLAPQWGGGVLHENPSIHSLRGQCRDEKKKEEEGKKKKKKKEGEKEKFRAI